MKKKETRGRKKLPEELKRDIKVYFKFNSFEKERFDSLMKESKLKLNVKSNATVILKALEKITKKK